MSVHPFFSLQTQKAQQRVESKTVVSDLSIYQSLQQKIEPTVEEPEPRTTRAKARATRGQRTLDSKIADLKVTDSADIPSTTKATVNKATVTKTTVTKAAVTKATVTKATVTKATSIINDKPNTPKATNKPKVKKVSALESAFAKTSKKNKPNTTTKPNITNKPTTPTTTHAKSISQPSPQQASCSTALHVSMTKPKFYSDTLEYKAQQEHDAMFGFYGFKVRPKKRYDHDFSRLDASIYGHAHIKQRPLYINDLPPATHHEKPTIHLKELIDRHQQAFFKSTHASRHHPTIRNKQRASTHRVEDVEAYLDATFPQWHTFPSCVTLSQLILNKNNQRKVHQQQSWNDIYRPKSSNGLLGARHNHIYLKEWLHQMKVAPMSAPAEPTKRVKKKKKAFFLKGEEEEEDDDFMPIKKLARETKKQNIKSNMILISGDHGVGKTASVYTVADQLGFEVFEINAGSKRSGKDIMGMVGEMAKSHHVMFGSPKSVAELMVTTKPSKKKRLNPCLSSQTSLTPPTGSLKNFLRKETPTVKRQPINDTKQSVILFEEVDLLFEEDRGFWTTVMELSQKSKRPIILTCNDPEQIPFENLCLQKVLEVAPPPAVELLPYLWLLCYSEGYCVDPADLICLVAFYGRDIRQLIQTLEMYLKHNGPLFQHCLGIKEHDVQVDIKQKCIPSRVATDTFRLARSYQPTHETLDMEQDDTLEDIEKSFENNAFLDAWLGPKRETNMIYTTTKDQLNGAATLWFEQVQQGQPELLASELEANVSVLNSHRMQSSLWKDIILDSSSYWDDVCDASAYYLTEYKDAVTKLLPADMLYQTNEHRLMMEYVPFIKQMLSDDKSPNNGSKTRSKRKRLYLPLSDDSVQTLLVDRPPVDETKFWIERLHST